MILIWVAGQVLLVGAAAWLLGGCLPRKSKGLLETWMEWVVLFITLAAGMGVALSALGVLGPAGYLIGNGAVLAFLIVGRISCLTQECRRLRDVVRSTISLIVSDRLNRFGAVVVGLILGVTGLLAMWAEPVVFDALSYRLPRIGYWLQEGSVMSTMAADPRLDYMPVVPDLLIAWMVSGSAVGWQAAALVQWGCGCLLLLATGGLARMSGLGRGAMWGAVLLCLSLPNVVVQFTTVHTDLVVSSLVAASVYLWRAGAVRGEASVAAGLAVGLALGAKGTVFYFGPTLLLWVGWWCWKHPRCRFFPLASVLAGIGAMLVFAVPGVVRNWQQFGGLFGPPEYVEIHHGNDGVSLEKTLLNLRSSWVQNLDPNSQPPGLGHLTRELGLREAMTLPTEDPHTYEQLNRRETLTSILQRTSPDADALGFGILVPSLALLGLALAMKRRPRDVGMELGVVAVGLGLFAIFFNAMQQWHPYGFRYFILAAPWLAVMATWGLTQLARTVQKGGWVLVGVASLGVVVNVLGRTHQAGWQAVFAPEKSRVAYVALGWSEWLRRFDHAEYPLRVALPFNRPLAAFFRNGTGRRVTFVDPNTVPSDSTAALFEMVDEAWWVMEPTRLIGREDGAVGRTWLMEGQLVTPFSLAAYRLREPDDGWSALVYQHTSRAAADGYHHALLVKPGQGNVVGLRFDLPRGSWDVTLASPAGREERVWAGGAHEMTLPMGTSEVVELQVTIGANQQVASDTHNLVPQVRVTN